MNKLYYLLFFLAFVSCKKDELKKKPLACFSFPQETVNRIGDTISFLNCSEYASSYIWEFGDEGSSTEKSPYHIYKKNGSFIIKLVARNENYIDTVSKNITIFDDILKAGVITISYFIHKIFEPDTIYLSDKEYDFNNDFRLDLSFSSNEFKYDDHGRQGYSCEANITLIDSTLKIAAYKLWSVNLIHFGDNIDSTLNWVDWQYYGRTLNLNNVLSTRNVFDQFYWDSTGYIGLKYEKNIGWLKVKVEDCNKIILYEYLIK